MICVQRKEEDGNTAGKIKQEFQDYSLISGWMREFGVAASLLRIRASRRSKDRNLYHHYAECSFFLKWFVPSPLINQWR
jgi:hypothetical protein